MRPNIKRSAKCLVFANSRLEYFEWTVSTSTLSHLPTSCQLLQDHQRRARQAEEDDCRPPLSAPPPPPIYAQPAYRAQTIASSSTAAAAACPTPDISGLLIDSSETAGLARSLVFTLNCAAICVEACFFIALQSDGRQAVCIFQKNCLAVGFRSMRYQSRCMCERFSFWPSVLPARLRGPCGRPAV